MKRRASTICRVRVSMSLSTNASATLLAIRAAVAGSPAVAVMSMRLVSSVRVTSTWDASVWMAA